MTAASNVLYTLDSLIYLRFLTKNVWAFEEFFLSILPLRKIYNTDTLSAFRQGIIRGAVYAVQ